MSNNQLNEIESAIIVAVKEGINEIDDLAKTLSLPGDITGGIVTKLVEQGYLQLTEKNIIIMHKKTLRLTEKGESIYPDAYQKLKELSEKTKVLWEKGERKYPQNILILTPFMSNIGLLNEYIAREITGQKEFDEKQLEKEVEAAEEAARIDLK